MTHETKAVPPSSSAEPAPPRCANCGHARENHWQTGDVIRKYADGFLERANVTRCGCRNCKCSQYVAVSLSPVQEEATPTLDERHEAATPLERFTEWFLVNYPQGSTIERPEWHAPKIFRAAGSAVRLDAKRTAKPDDQQNAGADDLLATCDINLPDGEPQPVNVTAQLDNGSGVTSAGGESGLPHRFRFTSAGRKIVALHADEQIEVAEDATHAELVAAVRHLVGHFQKSLAGSISERETLTAKIEETEQRVTAWLNNLRAAMPGQSIVSPTGEAIVGAALGQLYELQKSREAVARLSSENATKLQEVEALPGYSLAFSLKDGKPYMDKEVPADHAEYLDRSAVLSILRGS